MSLNWDYIAKLVVIGDSGTGKSSLTIRLCENRFVQQHDVTIGVEFGSRVVPVGSFAQGVHLSNESSSLHTQTHRYMKLSLWDTAGQETYKSITRSYFRGASGALLVFDIARRSTFESATAWLHDLRRLAEEDIVVILVGNKADLSAPSTTQMIASDRDRRQVTATEAREWCRENRVFEYVETSAKTGDGVESAFLQVANRIYENIEAGKYDLNDRRSGVKGSSVAAGRGAQQSHVNLEATNDERSPGGGPKCC